MSEKWVVLKDHVVKDFARPVEAGTIVEMETVTQLRDSKEGSGFTAVVRLPDQKKVTIDPLICARATEDLWIYKLEENVFANILTSEVLPSPSRYPRLKNRVLIRKQYHWMPVGDQDLALPLGPLTINYMRQTVSMS